MHYITKDIKEKCKPSNWSFKGLRKGLFKIPSYISYLGTIGYLSYVAIDYLSKIQDKGIPFEGKWDDVLIAMTPLLLTNLLSLFYEGYKVGKEGSE